MAVVVTPNGVVYDSDNFYVYGQVHLTLGGYWRAYSSELRELPEIFTSRSAVIEHLVEHQRQSELTTA